MDQIEMKPEDYRVEEMHDEYSSGGGTAGAQGPQGPQGGPPREGRPAVFAGRETFLDRMDIVIVFLAVFGGIFLLEMLLGGAERRGVLISLGANYGSFVERGEFWRLVTANFLHGGFAHLLVNGFSFYILGRFVERVYGRSRLFLVFLCTAVFAALVSWQANADVDGMISIGASGGIAGLLGLLTSFTLRYRESLDPRFRSNFFSNLLLILGLNIFIAVMDPRIDNWAHAGGFAAGMLAGWFVFVPAVLFQKHGTVPYLRWGVYAGVFILFAAFSAQIFAFVFSNLIPEKGPFRSALASDGSVQLAYPVFFELVRDDKAGEIHITNHLNHNLFLKFSNGQYAQMLIQELSLRGIKFEEGQLNGQKTLRAGGVPVTLEVAPKKFISGEQEFFLIAAPRGAHGPQMGAEEGAWAEFRIVKPGRITRADTRLLEACARKIFFTIGGAI